MDDYLEFCEEHGEKPEKPFNGKILVRVKPEIHRSLSDQAAARGVGLNDLIASHLESLATLGPEGIGHRTSDVPTAIAQAKVELNPGRRATIEEAPQCARQA